MPGAAIALFFALDQDLESFTKAGAVLVRSESVGDRTVRTFRLGDHQIFAAKLQSGQTESAVTGEIILARRAVDAVVSIGVVGALDDAFAPGTIIVVDKILGWQTGGVGPNGWTETPRSRPGITPWTQLVVPSDTQTAGVASGDMFIASEAERGRLKSVTAMPLVDMNLLGLQTAINTHHLPALHLRIVSDRANDEAGEAFRRFAREYRGELGQKTAVLIKQLPTDPASPSAYPGLKLLDPEP